MKKKYTSSHKAGFTLFEMLVTLAIMITLSGVVFFNHTKFESETEITNLAYQIALSVRQAQQYSVSVKQSGTSFDATYGLHFSRGARTEYILFADRDGNGLYTSGDPNDDMECSTGGGSECVEKVVIGRDNYIKGWRGIAWDGGDVVGYGDESDSADFLDVRFERPNHDAIFDVYSSDPGDYGDNPVNNFCDGDDCDGWAICLVSPEGREKRVVVYETGQISVENVDLDDVDDVCSA